MPRVLADHGGSVLVEFGDGSQQEMLKSAYESAFPGGAYPADDPTGAITRDNLLGAAAAPPAATEPAPQPELAALPPEPAAPPAAAGFGAPQPTGAFKLGGLGPAPAFPRAPTLGADTQLTPPPPGEEIAPIAPPPVTDPRRGEEIPTLPQTVGGVRDVTAARKDATLDLADVEAQEMQRVAGALSAHDAAATKLEADRAAADKEGRRLAKSKLDDVNKTVDSYQNAQIDRGRLWKNMSTGQRILAAISLGLSAIGQAKSRQGGQNPALAIILQSIEADVADQRADQAKLGESAEKKRGLYNEFLRQHGSDQASYELALAMSAQQAKRQVDVIAQQSGSERVKLAAQDMAAQLDAWGLDKLEGARQRYGEETYRAAQMRLAEIKAAGRGGGGAGAGRAARAGSIDDLASRLGVTQREDRERLVVVDPSHNEGFLAQTKEQAKEVNDMLASTDSYNEIASRLIRDIKKNGWEPTNSRWKSEAGGQMLADYQQLVAITKNIEALGALSADDRGFIEGMLGASPGGWRTGGGELAQLERTMRNVNGRLTAKLRRFGYRGTYSPVIELENKAESADLADRNLKLEAAIRSGDKGKVREASKELLDGLDSRYVEDEPVDVGTPGKASSAPAGSPRELSRSEKETAGRQAKRRAELEKVLAIKVPLGQGEKTKAAMARRDRARAELDEMGKKGDGGGEGPRRSGARGEAEKAIGILSRIPRKDRLIPSVDGDIDPLEELAKFTNPDEAYAGRKETTKAKREEARHKVPGRTLKSPGDLGPGGYGSGGY